MPIELNNYRSPLDRGAGIIKESLWVLTKFLFFCPTYPLPSALRCFVLRVFGAEVGNGVVIRSGVDITFPWRLKIGDYTWIGDDVKILNLANISIGSNCCISQRAFLCTGSHNFLSRRFDLIAKPIVVSDSSWIAALVFIGPGVIVGENSMVSAGCVVSRDVPDSHILSASSQHLQPVKKQKFADSVSSLVNS